MTFQINNLLEENNNRIEEYKLTILQKDNSLDVNLLIFHTYNYILNFYIIYNNKNYIIIINVLIGIFKREQFIEKSY